LSAVKIGSKTAQVVGLLSPASGQMEIPSARRSVFSGAGLFNAAQLQGLRAVKAPCYPFLAT